MLPPPPIPLASLGRASTVGAGVPTPPRPILRRMKSEPSAIGPDGFLFTDQLMCFMTSRIASKATLDVLVSAVDFGVDPAPRISANSTAGDCAICFEKQARTWQLCWNEQCDARYCSECIKGTANAAVSNAIYAVPWLKCPSCKGRVATNAWSGHAAEAYSKYEANAEALFTFRCSECHETGSFVQKHCPSNQLVKTLSVGESYQQIREAWRAFVLASQPPESIIELLPNADFLGLLGCIADVERRTCLHLAWLRKHPSVKTPCCGSDFCFKCKIGSHHAGITCEERQQRELTADCQFCPECAVPTVRSEGCDHIQCVCGVTWTWQYFKELTVALGPPAMLRDALDDGSLETDWRNDDMGGKTLLMYTATEGRIENSRLLIEASVDVNTSDDDGYTALLCALGADSGVYRPQIVDLLIEHGATIEESDVHVWMCSQASENTEGGLESFRRALELYEESTGCELDINSSQVNDCYLLQLALQCGRVAMARALIDQHGACVSEEAVFWLMEGPSADTEFLDELFTAGSCDVNATSENGETLVQAAMSRNKQDMVRHLVLNCSARPTLTDIARPVGTFWRDGSIIPMDVFDAASQRGADVWAQISRGGDGSRGKLLRIALESFTSTHCIAHKDKIESFVELLLGRWNTHAEAFAKSSQGGSLFIESIQASFWLVAKQLLKSQADLEAKGAVGRTPLLATLALGCSAGSHEMVELLLKAGVEVVVHDDNGVTPLELAERGQWTHYLQELKAAVVAGETASKSGDGTIENVGIKLNGRVQCTNCNQVFDSERARKIHWRFIHDPSRLLED